MANAPRRCPACYGVLDGEEACANPECDFWYRQMDALALLRPQPSQDICYEPPRFLLVTTRETGQYGRHVDVERLIHLDHLAMVTQPMPNTADGAVLHLADGKDLRVLEDYADLKRLLTAQPAIIPFEPNPEAPSPE